MKKWEKKNKKKYKLFIYIVKYVNKDINNNMDKIFVHSR